MEPDFDPIEVDGRAVLTPTSVGEIREILEEATQHRSPVKPVGWERDFRGHSFSDVAQPDDDGYSLALNGMSGRMGRRYGLDPEVLRDDVDVSRYYPAKGGTQIAAMNGALRAEGRALMNMGAYDGQTIAGAVATDTHGSGAELGPMSTFVASLVLVTTGGKVLRVEPDSGITSRRRHESTYPDVQLVQDDAIFNAVSVGLGCMGVVASLVLETRPEYWLDEERTPATWEEVRGELEEGAHEEVRHYQVAVNPYYNNDVGGRRAMVTYRRMLEEKPSDLTRKQRKRSFGFRLAQQLDIVQEVAEQRLANQPGRRAGMIDTSLQAPADESYISYWDNVLQLGVDPEVLTYESMEVGIPVDAAGDWIETVDGILDRLSPRASAGVDGFRPTGPINLRFVAESEAFLSPMHGRETTCMVEIPFLKKQDDDPAEDVDGMTRDLEEYVLGREGRPHWGKRNHMTWSKLQRAYDTDAIDAWLDAYDRFNSRGVFNNVFTQKLGISQ